MLKPSNSAVHVLKPSNSAVHVLKPSNSAVHVLKPSNSAKHVPYMCRTCVVSLCCIDYVYVYEFTFSDRHFLSTRRDVTISQSAVCRCQASVSVVDCVYVCIRACVRAYSCTNTHRHVFIKHIKETYIIKIM